MEKKKKIKKVFIDGPIKANFIADSIDKHSSKTEIGAHQIFLGQVRADEINGEVVKAIDYSAYTEMAEQQFHEIREAAFDQFDISCMHIYHSLGKVAVGEVCLFVFVSSPHRQASFDACNYLVEEIKKKAPVFGKEIVASDQYYWKENK